VLESRTVFQRKIADRKTGLNRDFRRPSAKPVISAGIGQEQLQFMVTASMPSAGAGIELTRIRSYLPNEMIAAPLAIPGPMRV
jgi:hypothetical protein